MFFCGTQQKKEDITEEERLQINLTDLEKENMLLKNALDDAQNKINYQKSLLENKDQTNSESVTKENSTSLRDNNYSFQTDSNSSLLNDNSTLTQDYLIESTECNTSSLSETNDDSDTNTSLDNAKIFLGILALFFPLIGYILYFVWKRNLPERAESILIFSFIGTAASILIGVNM